MHDRDDDYGDFDEGLDDADEEEQIFACPECGGDVYDDAERCPGCGHWVTDADRFGRAGEGAAWVKWVAVVLIVVVIVVWVVAGGS